MNKLITIAALLCLFGASCKKKGSDTPSPAVPATDTCTRPAWGPGSKFHTFSKPCGLALSPDGRIAVSQYIGGYGAQAKVSVYKSLDFFLNAGGDSPDFNYPIAKAPEALAFDAAGNLYIAETEQTAGITVLKKGSGYSYSFLKTMQGGFNNPRGMAFDAQSRLYLCDDGNNRVLRFDNPVSSNSFTTIISAGKLGSPKGIAITGSDMYIAEYSGNRVSKWKVDDYGAPVATTSVTKPVDVAANSCFVAVASPDAKSVQLFHSRLLSASAGTYNIGHTVYGIALDAQSASLLVTAYEAGQVKQYK